MKNLFVLVFSLLLGQNTQQPQLQGKVVFWFMVLVYSVHSWFATKAETALWKSMEEESYLTHGSQKAGRERKRQR